MSYDEIGEWSRAVHAMSEMGLAATEVDVRWSQGLCGDMEDAQ